MNELDDHLDPSHRPNREPVSFKSGSVGSGSDSEYKLKEQEMFAKPCAICRERFPTPSIYQLPCDHNICHGCAIPAIEQQEDETSFITCPVCQKVHPLDRSETQSSSSHSQPTIIKIKYCDVDGCEQTATHTCNLCGLLCATHEKSIHQPSSYSVHKSQTLLEQQQQQQKERGESIQNAETELKLAETAWSGKGVLVRQRNTELVGVMKAHLAKLDKLKNRIDLLQHELQKQKKIYQDQSTEFDQQHQEFGHLIQQKKEDVVQAKENSTLRPHEFQQLVSLHEVRNAVATLEIECKQMQPLPYFGPSSLLDHSFKLVLPTLYSSLSSELKDVLEQMLRNTSKTFAHSSLLYKASEHGWHQPDLIRECRGKSHTLILVKVAGNGYVFGAYIAPAWPTDHGLVYDSSKKSFLFSLINEVRWPFRLSLSLNKDNTPLILNISLTDGITFGYSSPNLILFHGNKPANDSKGNYSSPHRHRVWSWFKGYSGNIEDVDESQLDDSCYTYKLENEENHNLVRPPEFKLNEKTFGGGSPFEVDEIEVYQLSP